MAGSGFNALKNGVSSLYTGMNNLGSKIGNVLKQGAGGLDRGMSRAMGAGGKLVKGAAIGFAKTALGALKFAGACWSNCNCRYDSWFWCYGRNRSIQKNW